MSARKPPTPDPDAVLLLDLGSATLRAALVVGGRPQVVAFPSEGGRIPTAAGFDEGALVLGDLSRRLAITQPQAHASRWLRLAGLRHELAELDGGVWRQVPVARGLGGDIHFELGDERWPVARLLAALIQRTSAQIAGPRELVFERVIVAVAPGSDDARRRTILDALRIAGFDAVSLVHSTTAAALAWARLERDGAVALGFASLEAALASGRAIESAKPEAGEAQADAGFDEDVGFADDDESAAAEAAPEVVAPSEAAPDIAAPSEAALEVAEPEAEPAEPEEEEEEEEEEEQDDEPEQAREQLTLVLDLGAGSFDAALVRLDEELVEVLAARSRCDIGGDSIDERLVEWLLERFEADNEVDLSGDPVVRARMRDVAEKAKIALSDADKHDLRLPYLWADASGPKHLFVTLERERFERMIHEVVAAVAALAQAVVRDAGQDPNELDAIVMVGGTSRIPIIQDRLEGLFGRVPETELGNAALDEDFVVRGLALEAHRRAQRRPSPELIEIVSRDIWLEHEGAEPQRLVERGATLPVKRSFEVSVTDSRYSAWLWDGDEDDRARGPSGRVELLANRDEGGVALALELDGSGQLELNVGPRVSAEVRVHQRVGLSARARRRYQTEARERARVAAERDRIERLRRRVQELARLIEGWLTDPKVNLDDLLRTSLVAWGRDAEASFEQNELELFGAALESFLSLAEALPNKLRGKFDEAGIVAQIQLVGATAAAEEGEEEEPLGEASEDYGAAERVELLEAGGEEEAVEEDSEEAEAGAEEADAEADTQTEAAVEDAAVEDAAVEDAAVEEAAVEEAAVEEAAVEEAAVEEAAVEEAAVEEAEVEAAEPVVEAAEPVVEPAEPVVEAAEPVVEPAEPIVEPAKPIVEPAEQSEEAELAAMLEAEEAELAAMLEAEEAELAAMIAAEEAERG